MNFKKYHVSKNLLSEKYEKRSINGLGAFTIDSNFDLWIGEVVAGQTYTISNMRDVYGFFTAKPMPNTGVTYNGSREMDMSGTAVITVPSGCTWIAVRVLHNADNAMLNTGSTPQPYEPYSSEVWHDIPYYQHKTATDTLTLPATLYPNDTSITVGLKGNEEHTGTPTPDSPIMPQGTGERTGNLFDKDNVTDRRDLSASTGNLVNGQTKCVSDYIEISENTSYTTHNVTTYVLYNNLKEYLSGLNIETGGIRDVTIDNTNAKYIRIACEMDDKSTVMLNTGSTALPYEPYGIKIPISSASTTTPVYLGEVETTRKIRKLVLTGDEAFSEPGTYPGGYLYMFIPSDIPGDNGVNAVSTHYKQAYNNNGQNVYIQNRRIVIIDATHSTRDDFKSYLAAQYAAGTPVTIWYVLATEKTGIVNEPLMKIGEYADTLSGISIPVTAGGDTLSVGTTVQPSEVTISYKGWHPVADVHERNNGAWT